MECWIKKERIKITKGNEDVGVSLQGFITKNSQSYIAKKSKLVKRKCTMLYVNIVPFGWMLEHGKEKLALYIVMHIHNKKGAKRFKSFLQQKY